MTALALERMLDDVFVPDIAQDRMYQTIDRYAAGTNVLYSFDPLKTPGLMDPQPFQYGFELGGGLKLDLHGPNPTTVTYGHVKPQCGNEIIKEYNGYECSMLDPILKNNFKKFP